jgi:anti-anti-sigma regulatory factor
MTTHRTIFVVNLPFLDASNCELVDRAFSDYLSHLSEPVRVPVDFGAVRYMSSAIGVICYALQTEFVHTLVCMRLKPPILKVFDLLGWSTLPQFAFTAEGVCPACGETYGDR